MRKYDREFKKEAVKRFNEGGIKQAASQLGTACHTFFGGGK